MSMFHISLTLLLPAAPYSSAGHPEILCLMEKCAKHYGKVIKWETFPWWPVLGHHDISFIHSSAAPIVRKHQEDDI